MIIKFPTKEPVDRNAERITECLIEELINSGLKTEGDSVYINGWVDIRSVFIDSVLRIYKDIKE